MENNFWNILQINYFRKSITKYKQHADVAISNILVIWSKSKIKTCNMSDCLIKMCLEKLKEARINTRLLTFVQDKIK